MSTIRSVTMIKDMLEGMGKKSEELDPEEALAFLTNLLVELAFFKGMPVEVMLTAIELKYRLMEKAYELAGPNDEVH
jgi:hypothetical protein